MTVSPPVWSALDRSGNVARMLSATAARNPAREAVVAGEQRLTYAALAGRTGAVARAVRDRVRPGDRVAILLPRGPDAAAAYFGVLAAGAIAVTVHEALRPRQVDHILRHCGAALVLASAQTASHLPRHPDRPVPVLDLADVAPSDELAPAVRIDTDVAHLVYTSGSTGSPKGVTISHGNVWAGTSAVVSYLRLTEDDRIAALLPFSFDYGLSQLLCCAGTGATLVVERTPIAARIVTTLARERVTVLPSVPPLWLQLLRVGAFRTPLPALRVMTNTGGRLPTDAVAALRRHQHQAELVLMYGLTEAFRSTYLAPGSVDGKPGSIGRAIPGAEIMVLDEDFHMCGPGRVGQLVHRGPTVALGYWDDEAATAATFRPNPLRPAGTPHAERVVFSGDLVHRDADGDLFFVGRNDAMIKTLGFRVSPDEVTDALHASGEVAEAVVGAEPDAERGERIVAYVVLTEVGDLDRLSAFCARELPRYLRPSRFEVRTELPRTDSGKYDAAAAARHCVGDVP